jgi:hypothetical protein
MRSLALALMIVVVSLMIGTTLTRRTSPDEATHAGPAMDLLSRGSFGTRFTDEITNGSPGIHEHTYGIMPGYPLLIALIFKIFGINLFILRAFSLAAVLGCIFLWALILLELAFTLPEALLTACLVGTDYVIVQAAGWARPDPFGLLFVCLALLAWLRWRVTSLDRAVLLSQIGVFAAGMIHPNAGMLAGLGVFSVALSFDRRRLRWRHLVIAALPYVAGGALWAVYILQDPASFVGQLHTNSGGRFTLNPIRAILREMNLYLRVYGLSAPGIIHSSPVVMKMITLIAFLTGSIGCAATPELRRRPAVRTLLILWFVFQMFFTVLEGEAYYLIYIVPVYASLLACFALWLWETKPTYRVPAAAAVGLVMIVGAGGSLLKIRQNPYRTGYASAVEFLRQHAKPGDTVVGSADLGYAIGFANLTDDYLLGMYSGRMSDYVVADDDYYGRKWNAWKSSRPRLAEVVERRLATRYDLLYDQGSYRVFRIKTERR